MKSYLRRILSKIDPSLSDNTQYMEETPNLVLQVPPPEGGRRFAIGDIHGCALTLKHLLEEELRITQNDQVFPLGDYIDRGPRNGEAIDYLMDLMGKGFQVYPIMGNHEEMFLDGYQEYCLNNRPERMRRIYQYYNAEDLFGQEDGWPKPRYVSFMQHLHYCIDVGDGYLVHANLKPGINMLRDAKAMVWARQTSLRPDDLDGKWVIHGHTPEDIGAIRKLVDQRHFNIPLDNGCVFADGHTKKTQLDLGRLCALDLDSFELHEARNVDFD